VDTDFTAKLTDIYPDGRSLLALDGIIRARHRNTGKKDEFLTPGEIYEFDIDLWSTSLIFNTGHRIRLAISSSNYPRFDVNPNNGGTFRDDKPAVTARKWIPFVTKAGWCLGQLARTATRVNIDRSLYCPALTLRCWTCVSP
jgi:putative CocE/NonD family hydrolase